MKNVYIVKEMTRKEYLDLIRNIDDSITFEALSINSFEKEIQNELINFTIIFYKEDNLLDQ